MNKFYFIALWLVIGLQASDDSYQTKSVESLQTSHDSNNNSNANYKGPHYSWEKEFADDIVKFINDTGGWRKNQLVLK